MGVSRITLETWEREGERLFGPDKSFWKWVCPSCKVVQDRALFQKHTDLDDEAIRSAITGNCIGRHARRDGSGKLEVGCTYTTGGLFDLGPIKVFDGVRWYSVFGFDGGGDLPDDAVKTYANLEKLKEATGDASFIAWPDWVPGDVRKQVHDFWSCFGRTPRDYFQNYEQNLAPDFGVEGRFRGSVGEWVEGRYVHAWNNMGRVILPDGSVRVVSI